MRTSAFIPGFLAIAMLAPCCGASRPNSTSEPQVGESEIGITVYVAETCPVPPVVERVAQTTASRLFERIGVRLRFTPDAPRQADPGLITLHILNRAPKNIAPEVVGAAHIDSGHGLAAFVFCDRIAAFYPTDRGNITGILLGYAIAHELGHVLEATPGHSPDGVMKACWKRADILLMLHGVMVFSKTDAARIRAAQAARREVAVLSVKPN